MHAPVHPCMAGPVSEAVHPGGQLEYNSFFHLASDTPARGQRMSFKAC
jgi:hypothetical protein